LPETFNQEEIKPMFRSLFGSKSAHWRIGLVAGALVALVAVAALTPFASHAQSAAAVITIAVQDQQKELYTNTIIPAFEKDNPNIIVQAVSQTAPNVPPAARDVNNFLDGTQTLVSESDVVLVGSNNVTAESTRAGYFLNLQPLIDSDQSLNQADFYPNVFRAFQWDQGTWALPTSTDATVLTYDPAAFDKAGVNYPTTQWTLDDLIAAVKKLTITDQSGAVVTPGIELFGGNNDIPL
jgi:multiple sugar transport system substrate-binding protein